MPISCAVADVTAPIMGSRLATHRPSTSPLAGAGEEEPIAAAQARVVEVEAVAARPAVMAVPLLLGPDEMPISVPVQAPLSACQHVPRAPGP